MEWSDISGEIEKGDKLKEVKKAPKWLIDKCRDILLLKLQIQKDAPIFVDGGLNADDVTYSIMFKTKNGAEIHFTEIYINKGEELLQFNIEVRI